MPDPKYVSYTDRQWAKEVGYGVQPNKKVTTDDIMTRREFDIHVGWGTYEEYLETLKK